MSLSTSRLLVLGVAMGACAPADRDLAEAIHSAAQSDSVSMRDVATFPWDSLFVFGPYTPSAAINRALGFSWSGANRMESVDAFVSLVFVTNGRVTRVVDQSRGGADFSPCSRLEPFAPSTATFHFATDSTGWRSCTRVP